MPDSQRKEQRIKSKENNLADILQSGAIGSVAEVGENVALKEEIARWFLTIMSSVLVLLVVVGVVGSVYEADVQKLAEEATKLLIVPENSHPEPKEGLLFRVGVATILCCLAAFYALFTKLSLARKLTGGPFFPLLSVLVILSIPALIAAGFAAPSYYDAAGKLQKESVGSNFSFYFEHFFFGDYFLLYTLVIVPAFSYVFFVTLKKRGLENRVTLSRLLLIAGYLFTSVILLLILLMNTFSFPYSTENKFDFNAVYYSMTQVFAGSPMLVDGFTNTYGLYPHFLVPLFHLVGLSVFKFSLVMSSLTCLCFVLNFLVLKMFVRNNILIFLGFATMLFFSYLLRKVEVFDCFFSYVPIRYIAPSVCTLMAAIHFCTPNRWVYWCTFIALAFLVLWNPEFGIVTYLSWVAANCYRDFYNAGSRVNVRKIAQHSVAAILILPLAFITYKMLIYCVYGTAPDMELLWSTMLVFGRVGFNLLPMDAVHPWNTVALVLVFGFTYAISKLHKKLVNARSAIVFLLSLIGTGYLFYFQGRSHNSNLALSSGFAILLLTILGDELWDTVKGRSVFVLNGLFAIFLFLISFSLFDLLYKSPKLYSLVYQEADKERLSLEQDFTSRNREFILANSRESDKVHILTVSKLAGLYFDGSKRRSAFNPGVVELFLRKDLDRFTNMLRDSSFSVFLEPILFNYRFMRPALTTLSTLYEYKANGASMVLLLKRKVPIPDQSFFQRSGQGVLLRKYNDNTSGIAQRSGDAFGSSPVTMDSAFSVQILFRSTPQVYPYATLVGNMDNGKGFVIASVFNSNNYLFGFNERTFKFPVPQNQWVYLAAVVRPGHIEVYRNGEQVVSEQFNGGFRQSTLPIHIGNLGVGHYHVGAISEVSINNRALEGGEIEATWAQIKQAIVTGFR